MRKGSTTNWPENLPGREKKIENLTIKNLMIITRLSYRHYSRLQFQPIECKYSEVTSGSDLHEKVTNLIFPRSHGLFWLFVIFVKGHLANCG